MLNLPGDLVRRAAANVSSTVSSVSNTVSSGVSTVASVATGSRRRSLDRNSAYQDEDQILVNAKEKYTLNVKCTPNKDAVTTANLAIRSGFIMKRNEQGVYHRKFVCVVPHSFMYYFDSETAESPRGVIDLELYTNISREDNTMKVATSDEEKLRVFYFEDEDRENLNNWSSTIIRDRFVNVCEERNAYQQMQLELTGVVDTASVQRRTNEVERSTLESELEAANKQCVNSLQILQSMLVIVGITEEDMKKLSDVNKIGHALKQGIIELKASMEKKYDDSVEMIETLTAKHIDDIERLEERLRVESELRKELELNILSERKEFEARLAQSVGEVDNAMMNFQIAVTSRTATEAKNTTLGEQKKVLVKEVKQLRKKLDDSVESIALMRELNEKLVTATADLHEQLKVANEALAHSNAFKPPAESHAASVSFLLAENAKAVQHIGAEGSGGGEDSVLHSPGDHSKRPSVAEEGGDLDHDHHPIVGSGGSPQAGQQVDSESRLKWETSPGHLKDLGWLSPEQTKMLDRRLSETSTTSNASSAHSHEEHKPAHRSSLYMFSNAAMSMMGSGGISGSSTSTTAHTEPSSAAGVPAADPAKESTRRSSMFSSMFSSAAGSGSSSSGSGAGGHRDGKVLTSSYGAALSGDLAAEDPEDRMPSAMRLRCLRCDGSVEGPKYSTCKCSVPALCQEDLQSGSSLSMFSGFMSKGASAAGSMAGGIMKAGGSAIAYSSSSVGNSSSSSNSGNNNNNNNTPVKVEGALNEDLADEVPAAGDGA